MYVCDMLHKKKICLVMEFNDETHIIIMVQNQCSWCTHLVDATPSSGTLISLIRAIVRKQEICVTRTTSLLTSRNHSECFAILQYVSSYVVQPRVATPCRQQHGIAFSSPCYRDLAASGSLMSIGQLSRTHSLTFTFLTRLAVIK